MEPLQKTIPEQLARGGNGFAVIDFDNTCIVNDIAEAALAYACEHVLLKNKNLLPEAADAATYHAQVFRAYYAFIHSGDTKSAYLFCARAFAGYTEKELD